MKRHDLSSEIEIIDGDFTEGAGITAARTLLARTQRPTAVCAANDRSAIGLLDELRRADLDIPGDIAVKAVVEPLDDHRSERRNLVLQPKLIVRHTTAAGLTGIPQPDSSGRTSRQKRTGSVPPSLSEIRSSP